MADPTDFGQGLSRELLHCGPILRMPDFAKARRERIACYAIAGLAAHDWYDAEMDAACQARNAVKLADALIAELDK